ncbi:MAG: hypothetical protein M3Q52_08365 [Pseudomonadota bacterium]|nr:hypothetical protein [Pseudomonadota bacterium]
MIFSVRQGPVSGSPSQADFSGAALIPCAAKAKQAEQCPADRRPQPQVTAKVKFRRSRPILPPSPMLFAVRAIAFVAVPPDHNIGLVDQPVAFGNALAQPLLVGLELASLPVAPCLAAFLGGDLKIFPPLLNRRRRKLIQNQLIDPTF